MPARVGDEAPDFTLPGTGGRDYTLSSYRGAPVVLIFYPGDRTPVCTVQLRSYTTDYAEFDELGATILGISPQDVESHESFSAEEGFAFPLLADTEKSVAEQYGVLGPLGFYRRSAFVVDPEGVIRYAHRAISGMTFRPTDELVEAIKAAARA
jgi:peroxiredoxin Q/BCP